MTYALLVWPGRSACEPLSRAAAVCGADPLAVYRDDLDAASLDQRPLFEDAVADPKTAPDFEMTR